MLIRKSLKLLSPPAPIDPHGCRQLSVLQFRTFSMSTNVSTWSGGLLNGHINTRRNELNTLHTFDAQMSGTYLCFRLLHNYFDGFQV